MAPAELKRLYGNQLTFFGGGVDTQRTLAFGSPGEVPCEVKSRIRALAPKGAFVFAAIHDKQRLVPVENILPMLDAARVPGAYGYDVGWQLLSTPEEHDASRRYARPNIVSWCTAQIADTVGNWWPHMGRASWCPPY
ncbi:MAG: hypothetical protein ABSB61_06440 [Anaerolineales bacterium]|jgi:hypothetical protein